MANAASSTGRSSQLLERREQENEGPTKHHRQSGERKYEAKEGEESLERSLHFKGSGKFGQNSIFQTFFTKKLNNENHNGFVLHQNLDLPGKSHFNHSSNLNKDINYAATKFNPSINKYLHKEPWTSKSTSSSFSLSTSLNSKSRDHQSATLNKAIYCVVNLYLTPQGQSHLSTHVIDHASAHNLMDKDKHLLGNQHCAHQLSLLRNKQQRKSRDIQTMSANEPTMKDKYGHHQSSRYQISHLNKNKF